MSDFDVIDEIDLSGKKESPQTARNSFIFPMHFFFFSAFSLVLFSHLRGYIRQVWPNIWKVPFSTSFVEVDFKESI